MEPESALPHPVDARPLSVRTGVRRGSWAPRRRVIGGGARVLALFGLSVLCACSAQRTSSIAPWQATALSADGRTLTLRYRHDGGDCGGLDRVDVGETDRGVLLTVHVWRRESRVPCEEPDVDAE